MPPAGAPVSGVASRPGSQSANGNLSRPWFVTHRERPMRGAARLCALLLSIRSRLNAGGKRI
jgi:hypothetical protein